MRVMVIVKATEDSEAGVMPSTELLEAMGSFNEELVNAGVMLAGEGLHPSSRGKRVAFDGPERTVVDGPFAETAELASGLLAMASAGHGRSGRVGKALSKPHVLDAVRDRDQARVFEAGGLRRSADAGARGAGRQAAQPRFRTAAQQTE